MIEQIIAATLGGLGFSLVFGVRNFKYMFLSAINAGLSWSVYLIINKLMGSFAANMISAMFCSLMAAIMAPFCKVPVVVLQMPATVPMIPGGSLYYMMYYIFCTDWSQTYIYFISSVRTIFAMAIGFAIVSVFLKTLSTKMN